MQDDDSSASPPCARKLGRAVRACQRVGANHREIEAFAAPAGGSSRPYRPSTHPADRNIIACTVGARRREFTANAIAGFLAFDPECVEWLCVCG